MAGESHFHDAGRRTCHRRCRETVTGVEGFHYLTPGEGARKPYRLLQDAMTEEFHAEDYSNEYEEQVREWLKAKAEGKKFVAPERPKEEVETKDLVDALTNSLETMKK